MKHDVEKKKSPFKRRSREAKSKSIIGDPKSSTFHTNFALQLLRLSIGADQDPESGVMVSIDVTEAFVEKVANYLPSSKRKSSIFVSSKK